MEDLCRRILVPILAGLVALLPASCGRREPAPRVSPGVTKRPDAVEAEASTAKPVPPKEAPKPPPLPPLEAVPEPKDFKETLAAAQKLQKLLAPAEARERLLGQFYANPNLALAKLKVEKLLAPFRQVAAKQGVTLEQAAEMLDKAQGLTRYLRKTLDATRGCAEANTCLKRVYDGQTALPDQTGMFELAYVSEIDDSAQPYFVTVPETYDKAKPHPLIVYLHGYAPELDKVNWWSEGVMRNTQLNERAAANGWLAAYCFGRANTDFQGIGEADVLRVVEEMKRLFSVDPDRVFLTGLSMGGLGAWTIAAHYPQVFAGTIPISGRADFYLWQVLSSQWGFDTSRPVPFDEMKQYAARLSPFQRWLFEGDFARPLVENLRNVPVLMLHGDRDHLDKVAQSRMMAQLLKERGYEHRYDEIQGGDHWIGYERAFADDRVFDWMRDRTREPWPKRVTYKTYYLRYNRAYWVTIDELTTWGKPASVDAHVVSPGEVEIKTENVAQLTLSLGDKLAPAGKPVSVTLNGAAKTYPFPKDGRLVLRPSSKSRPALVKRHALTGPIKDAYLSPFTMVYGTAGPPEAAARSKRNAHAAARDWEAFAKAWPRVKADEHVSEGETRAQNLILFGTPATNLILKKIADKLPIQIAEHSFTVGEQTFGSDDVGLAMIYPNPLNAERYVVVYSGQPWGEGLPFNHKFDLLPDYIIFSSEYESGLISAPYAGRGPNKHVCAGLFDANWKVDQELMWLGR